jgi:hypothetical protein
VANDSQLLRGFSFWTVLGFFFAALLFVGCEQKSTDSAKQSSASGSKPPVVAGPGPNEKVCFQCNGVGTVVCPAPGCKEGKVDCPGACLKLTRGTWIHMTVDGHGPNELWQKFPNSSGLGGYQAWNQNHVGEVVVYQNGVAVNIGKCKVCGGTTKVTCSACKGTGKQTCEICNEKKFIPVAWTRTDNPWFNSQPDLIRLKDGQVILGRVALSSGEDRMIVTRDKKVIHVNASDILPKTNTNSPSPQTSSSKD